MAVIVFGCVAPAQAVDTPQSAAYRDALAARQAQETASFLVARRALRVREVRTLSALPAGLAALRRHASQACLGVRIEPPLPAQRPAQPPVAVSPVAAAPPPARPPALPSTAPGPPAPSPMQIAPPPVVVSCDAAGCWASDGTRLVRAGPRLLGPRGLCSVQGSLLHCP